MLDGVASEGHYVGLVTDQWSIELDGSECSSGELIFTQRPESDASFTSYVGSSGRFTFVMSYRRATVSGRDLLVRTIDVRAEGNFLVGRVAFRVTPAELVQDAVELRTFSESPFAAALRVNNRTLLIGVQNPHTTTTCDVGVEIDYEAAVMAAGSFQISAQFFAVADRSGISIQPVHPKSRVGVGESRPRARFRNPSEAIAVDASEIASLRAVVRDYLSPLPVKNRFILYTYWFPLPHAPATAADEQLWIATIDNFADLGGDLLLTVPLIDATVPHANPEAFWDLEPEGSSAARIMNYARSRGLEVGYYMGVAAGNLPFSNAPGLGLPVDGEHAWRKVRADGSLALENCLAHEDYAQWLETVSANTIARFGLSAWSWDPGPGDGAHCFSSDHGHLPGRGEHAGWLRGKQLTLSLHARFPGLHLQGYYGQKQDGTWGMAGISQHEGYWEQQGEWGGGLYPELSAERLNANGVRHQAWWSQNFRYLPAETNHALFGRMSQICVEDVVLGQTFDWWGWRFGLLSAIAIGGAPTAATLPPLDVPAEIRDEYRWWLEWARLHSLQWDFDVAGGAQVELGAADWYLRGNASEAHLFLCNPGPRGARVRVPLREHLSPDLMSTGRMLRLQGTALGDALGDEEVPEFLDVEVPAYDVIAYTVSAAPERVETRIIPSESLPGSAMIPIDRWLDQANRRVSIPHSEPTAAMTISCTVPGLPRLLSASEPQANVLRATLPDIPDTFSYVDLDRVVLVIPLLDADVAPTMRVAVNGVDANAEIYRYAHDQMGRYDLAAADVEQWPETSVVWWCDLTPYLGAEPVRVSIDLPPLGPNQFLGPYLQAPRDLVDAFADLVDPTVVYSGTELEVFPPLIRAQSSGPRVTDAWITPATVTSNSGFTLFVRAENADEVYAALHVGAGSLSDRRLSKSEGEPGLWILKAHVYRRAAIILDRAEAVLWATKGNEVSEDFRIRIPWELDPLAH